MARPQSIVLPSAVLGCLIVAWLGTTAALKQPVNDHKTTNQASQQGIAAQSGSAALKKSPGISGGNCTLNPAFPGAILQWCALIERYTAKEGVPPGLIASVMLEESGGNPDAISSSGAVGLMQVMPRDGLAAAFQCKNGPCFANRPKIAQLLDPEFNISYGTAMLANLIKKYGSKREALRAYGPMDVGYAYADIVLSIWSANP